jgi:hypothetical protein
VSSASISPRRSSGVGGVASLLVQDFLHLLVIASSFGEVLREQPLLRPAFALNGAAVPPIVYRPLDALIFCASVSPRSGELHAAQAINSERSS